MTLIRATCPSCGYVEITDSALILVVCDAAPDLSYYEFPCPRCRQMVHRHAEPEAIGLLQSVGICARPLLCPAEILEPHVGPPIGYDDLLDFAMGLVDGDPWAELTP